MKISPKRTILARVVSWAKQHPVRRHAVRPALLSVAMLCSSATATSTLPSLGNSSTKDGELAELGREAMISASRRNPVLQDPELYVYLAGLLDTLRSANGMNDQPFELTVFADRSVNAFALPGGYIGVFAGLMLSAPSESSLVSVLAHEMAHLSQRHIHRFMEHQSQASLAAMAAIIAAAVVMRGNADAAQATIYSGLASANQSLLDYSRAHEREADRTGQRLMSRAGFRPAGMAEMFEALAHKEQLNQGHGLEYLQTHPVTQSRIADAWESARGFDAGGNDDAVVFSLLQARVATLVGAPVHGAARPYALALEALRAAEPQRAQQELAALDPALAAHRSAQLLQARIDAALGQHTAALEQLTELQTDYPDWYPSVHWRAQLQARAGKPAQAAEILQRWLRERASVWPLSYQTASIYFHQAGDELNTLKWRAEHHATRRNYAAAASLLEQALERAPEQSATAVRLQSRLQQIQERALQERPSKR